MRRIILPDLAAFELVRSRKFCGRLRRSQLGLAHITPSMDVGIAASGGSWPGQEQFVDATFGAARTQTRPYEFRSNSGVTGGHYFYDQQSGVIAGAVAANAPLFAWRWAPTSALYCAVLRVIVNVVSTAISSPTYTDLEIIRATSFTSMDTGGTSPTLTNGITRAFTSMMSASQMLAANIMIANTGALSAGTRTLDAAGCGYVQYFNSAANNVSGLLKLFDCTEHGKHPLVLASNEGFIIRTIKGWASSNSQVLGVTVDWCETPCWGMSV